MPRDVQDKKISVFGLSINECLTKGWNLNYVS